MFAIRSRLTTAILYACALLCLLLIGWATWRMIEYPESGASWSFVNDVVSQVDPGGPADGRLQPGDRILTVNGVPLAFARDEVARWRAGDRVQFVVERGGTREMVEIVLAPPVAFVWARMVPLMIALGFWALGVVTLIYAPGNRAPRTPQILHLFVFALAVAGALAAGAMSDNSGLAFNLLFAVLMWWAGALAVVFHLGFPVAAPSRDARRTALALVILALCGSAAESYALLGAQMGLVALFFSVRRIWLAACFAISVALLVRAYRAATNSELRRRVGIVSLGGGLALTPFLLLSLLPDAILHEPLLPYYISFLFLLLIPLSYGYAVLHYRLLRLDRYVSRTAAYLLVIGLLAGLYLACYALLALALPVAVRSQPVVNLALVLVLALAAHPLYRRLQALVSRFLYGGWYDYRSAVSQIGQSLEQASDENLLAESLCRDVQSALQLHCACLLLRSEDGERFVNVGRAGPCACAGAGGFSLASGDALVRHLETISVPIASETLHRRLQAGGKSTGEPALGDGARQHAAGEGSCSDGESKGSLAACGQIRLWAPIRTHGRLAGLLLLGPQRGGDDSYGVDLDILGVATQQAGVAFENIRLLAGLRRSVQESERLHRQTLQARDDERKRLARDLHDQVIQALVGLNYGLAALRSELGPPAAGPAGKLQEEVRELLCLLRGICADLRPPALDTLGLAPALRARLREIETGSGLPIRLNVEGDAEQELPEAASLCLFWVLQEALANVQRHAAATAACVELRITPDRVSLSIADDGKGFAVPARLGELTEGLHFGLVGVQERVELLGGEMAIASAPGQGCRLAVSIPLAAEPPGGPGRSVVQYEEVLR